jgi:hypothetical protein
MAAHRHLRHDADEWDRLAKQSREHGHNQGVILLSNSIQSRPSKCRRFVGSSIVGKRDRQLLNSEFVHTHLTTLTLLQTRNAFTTILNGFHMT